MKRISLLLLAAVLAVGACSPVDEPLFQTRLLAFGTLVDLSIWGASPEQAERAAEALSRDLNYMNETWHAWRPSTLSALNGQLASGKTFRADPAVLPLVRQSRALAEASGELFDPAIGKLIALWGFHSDEPHGPPPDPRSVAQLVAQHPTMRDIHIDGDTLRCDNPAVQLDFGGFAKGYGVDRMIEKLQAMGIRNAIVNAGGDLRAIGRHGERPWHIGIQHPRAGGVLASLETDGDDSVFTSGDYERYYVHEGRRFHHIIDPRTGFPAEGASSVTVIHDNGAEADAAATALLVAGPAQWYRVAKSMGIKYVMLVDAGGDVHMNPAMATRVHFEVEPIPHVILSDEL